MQNLEGICNWPCFKLLCCFKDLQLSIHPFSLLVLYSWLHDTAQTRENTQTQTSKVSVKTSETSNRAGASVSFARIAFQALSVLPLVNEFSFQHQQQLEAVPPPLTHTNSPWSQRLVRLSLKAAKRT